MTKQSKIYDEFRTLERKKTIIEGTLEDKGIKEKQGGYIVALRHGPEVNKIVTVVANVIKKVYPAISYDDENIHTTLITHKVSTDFKADGRELESLIEAVEKTKTNEIIFNYGKPLFNQTSVIWEGFPDQAYVQKIEDITTSYSQKTGETLKKTNMAHVTVNRFKAKVFGEDMHKLAQFLDKAPSLDPDHATSIDVGYFQFDKDGDFKLHVYKSIKLPEK